MSEHIDLSNEIQLDLQIKFQEMLMEFENINVEKINEADMSIHDVLWAISSSLMSFVWENLPKEELTEEFLENAVTTMAEAFADKYVFLSENHPKE